MHRLRSFIPATSALEFALWPVRGQDMEENHRLKKITLIALIFNLRNPYIVLTCGSDKDESQNTLPCPVSDQETEEAKGEFQESRRH